MIVICGFILVIKLLIMIEAGYYNVLNMINGYLLVLEDVVGVYILCVFFEYYLCGDKCVYIYEFFDEFDDLGLMNFEVYFGLLYWDFLLKLVYIVMKNLFGLFSDLGFLFML